MPTNYTDQFFFIDPFNPPPVGTPMNFSNLVLTDQNDDGDLDRFDNDSVNGIDITASYLGDTVTINVAGVGNVTYTGITFYLADGSQVFTPTDGQVLQNGTLVSTTWVSGEAPLLVGSLGPPCFTPGTLIDTSMGPRPAETIRPGDLVLTRDHGFQLVRWVGKKTVAADAEHAPVRFDSGAIGNELPLLVSPNHRMLITGWSAQLCCGEDELLVAAKHLVNESTIRFEMQPNVDYLHLLFDRHEILCSQGVWSESFFAGGISGTCDRDTRREIAGLFPELVQQNGPHLDLARPEAHGFEGRLLAA